MQAGKWLQEKEIPVHEVMASEEFSTHEMYKKLRGNFSKVPWRKLTCNNQGSPKWIFILYLAIQRKLYTRDRLSKWRITTDVACPFCQEEAESHQQLFFKCEISARIWKIMLEWLEINRSNCEWEEEIQWAIDHASRKGAQTEVYRIMLVATIYFVWQERNRRIFQQKERTLNVITKLIIQDVHVRATMYPRLNTVMNSLNFYPSIDRDRRQG